jgi:plastocyanin
MSNQTIFYILGGALAISAVLVSFFGLRDERFPGRLLGLVILYFAVLVGGTATFAVFNAQDEVQARDAENAQAAAKATIAAGTGGKLGAEAPGGQAGGAAPAKPVKGPGGTLQLAANPTQLLFDKKSLSSKPGKVTIDFDNPSAISHDVGIEQNGKPIAVSKLIAQGKTSVSADLAPGTYTFLCTVPGHAQAGMQGTLTVK